MPVLDDGYYRSFDRPSLVPSPHEVHLSPEERMAMEEEWRVELARVQLLTLINLCMP